MYKVNIQSSVIELFLKNWKYYLTSFNTDISDKLFKSINLNINHSHKLKNINFFINNNYNYIQYKST